MIASMRTAGCTDPPGTKVIELGGGAYPQHRPNVDVRPCFDAAGHQMVDFTADFGQPLPILSEEWDVVFSRYAIEHISWRQIRGFMAEVFRILKLGGTAVIITANGEAQMRWALARDWDEKVSQCLGGDWTTRKIATRFFSIRHGRRGCFARRGSGACSFTRMARWGRTW